MTWSFDPNLGSNKDKVRSLVGDTNDRSPLVSDEAINGWLTEFDDNVREAAAAVAEGLAAEFARKPNIQIDGFRIDNAAKVKLYSDMATRLHSGSEADTGGELGVPIVGGISIGTMASVEDDTDRVKPLMSQEVWEDGRD